LTNTHNGECSIPYFGVALFFFDEERFRQAFQHADSAVTAFKDAINAVTEQFDTRFREGENIRRLIYDRATFIDCMLHYAWHQFQWHDTISLIAVGGYGRGELHPKSDIDILILLDDNANDEHRDAIEKFLALLWDIGLDIGHSVRSVSQCIDIAAQDITVTTNLMECRTLNGPQHLAQILNEKAGAKHMWPNEAFFQAKMAEQQNRHKKYGNTEYNLEPNIKNAPGGLRDIQTIQWIAKRFFGVKTLAQLEGKGFFTEGEAAILHSGEEFLWKVRYGLHMLAKRPEERLLFDYQNELAAIFGYHDNDERLGIEQFMHMYYRVVLALRELNDVLLQFLDEAIVQRGKAKVVTPINERFQLRDGYIEANHIKVFSESPSALLEIFVLIGKSTDIIGVRASTIRLMRESRELIDDAFCNDTTNCALFLELLRSPHGLVTQLKRMKRYGILGRYLPEFGRIIGQMQHDLFHMYTVDAHTLLVVKFMRRFHHRDAEQKFPVAAHIVKRLPKIELLYIAGLYHDIAKGRGGDHSTLGATDAQAFCERHSLSRRDTRLVMWLVANHLLMSSVSQKQDLSDPEIIHNFALHVGDQNQLDHLYALTVADMNATNPDIWNNWRASLLRQLYMETKRALRRGLENTVDRQDLIEETQQAVLRRMMAGDIDEQHIWELWQTAGEDYFLRENAADIAWHTEAILNHPDPQTPLILIKESQSRDHNRATQIFIRAKDKYNIFAAATTALEQLNLNIQDAQIYSTVSGYTMDTFYVLNDDGEPIINTSEAHEKVIVALVAELSLVDNYSDIIQRRTPRQLKYFTAPTRTSISNDIKHDHTVLEVISPDRTGLLALIARIFIEYNIEVVSAKISTLGERVEDVFFITNHQGLRLSDSTLCETLQNSICQQLDEQISPSSSSITR